MSQDQIGALESDALLLGMAWLRPAPPMADVRDSLKEVRHHTQIVSSRLSSMFKAAKTSVGPRRVGSLAMAANAIMAAATDCDASPKEVDAVRLELGRLVEWCDRALSKQPRQQRSRAAHPFPVARIWQVLARQQRRGHTTIRLSSSEDSQFRAICGICYEAMTGEAGADPERAIKAFIASIASK